MIDITSEQIQCSVCGTEMDILEVYADYSAGDYIPLCRKDFLARYEGRAEEYYEKVRYIMNGILSPQEFEDERDNFCFVRAYEDVFDRAEYFELPDDKKMFFRKAALFSIVSSKTVEKFGVPEYEIKERLEDDRIYLSSQVELPYSNADYLAYLEEIVYMSMMNVQGDYLQ